MSVSPTSLSDVYITAYQDPPQMNAPPSARIYVRENPETEAVSAYLNGKVPEYGSNVVELVRKMVF
jgi:hypothetical protein